MQDIDSYLYSYYTFNDLVLSLRDKYKEHNEILRKLESEINIYSEFETEYRFITDLKETDDLDQETDLVLLVTTKIHSEDGNKVYSTNYEFKVFVEDNNIKFERISLSRYEREEDFTIAVINDEMFKKDYEELKESFFYKANMIDTSIDHDYTSHIDSNEMEIVKYLNAGHSVSVTYNAAKDDQTVFKTGEYDGLNAILNKSIPSKLFPDNYNLQIKKGLHQEVLNDSGYVRKKIDEK